MAAIAKLVGNFTEIDIDDEIIVMRLDNGELLSLTDTAATIWRLIDGNHDRRSLITTLAAQFAIDEEHITPAVDEFMARLGECGLIADG